MKQIAIIGFGKLGSHLYYALKRAGKYKIKPAIKHKSSKIRAQDFKYCNTIFICTEDSAISSVVSTLLKSHINLRDRFVYHTSGTHSSELLLPLQKSGARIGSFHPVQTFESIASKYSGRLKGIYVVIEGSRSAISEGQKIAKALGAKPIELSRENKVLHHICCVFASNYLVAHASQIERIAKAISTPTGSKKRLKNGFYNRNYFGIYKPLIEQTLSNINNKGIANSLTGPIERNDIKTIELHLETLAKELSGVLPYYVLLGIEAIDLALKKKSLDIQDANKLMELMNRYM